MLRAIGGLLLLLLAHLLGADGVTKVNVTIFYESRCPYCTMFLREQFSPYWIPLQYNLNLKLVPYGKCALNKIMTCAIKHFPGYNDVVPFVLCLQHGSPEMLDFCAGPLPVDHARLKTCVDGDEGDQLLTEMYHETEQLIDELKARNEKFYIPSIVFDGNLKVGADTKFGREVCRRLTVAEQNNLCDWYECNGQVQRPKVLFAVLVLVVVAGLKSMSLLS
ncbi:unnamed protein product [Soboliphyme baturini]|uniref:Thioredoxin-like_fold domain-containing protein n=1 Tax=Soboliphyme baturini TaxID=241478 RepID=A0A183J951_9BILA|nr:unnamed protein product [Soboliphyme baturini]